MRCQDGKRSAFPEENPMNESHFVRNALLAIVGIIAVGFVAVWLFQLLFHLLLYVIVGLAIVGGGYYLVRRSRAIGSSKRRRIGQ
jgi:positive regulator of sigma E activity